MRNAFIYYDDIRYCPSRYRYTEGVYKEDVQNEVYLQYICSSHQESAKIYFALSNIVERSGHKGKS